MAEKSILVVGRNGQLARCLRDLSPAHPLPMVTLGRSELDLETHQGLDKLICSISPSVIVNAAAYTAVDQSEADVGKAFSINRDGAAALADAAWQRNIPLVHLSTDYVFSGTKTDLYDESDVPSPLNVYGASKLAGEAAVLAAHPLATVLRCSWLYSPYGSNFVRTMLRLSETRPVVRVVQDQVGNPTSALDLASAIFQIAERLLMVDRRESAGIFHLAGQGETTWYGFAEAIFEGLSRRGILTPKLEAITTAEYPTKALRPANSRLDSSKAERVLGIRLPAWRSSLETCLDQLIGKGERDSEGNRVGLQQWNAPLSDNTRAEQGVTTHLSQIDQPPFAVR